MAKEYAVKIITNLFIGKKNVVVIKKVLALTLPNLGKKKSKRVRALGYSFTTE